MEAANRVLIVDDDKFIQKVLTKSLSEQFDVYTANDGEEAIAQTETIKPDMILLDVEMPGRNGYEVCDYLKRQQSSSDIPIIFLSSRSSVRERMLGFEVGGDDYLVKPCEKELLLAKLNRVRNYKIANKALQSSYETAQQTALEAITTNSELGKAVRYIERSYLMPTFDKLGDELMGMMRSIGLSASVMFVSRNGMFFSSTHRKEPSPIEQELLQLLHTAKRFVDFGCRTQINYPRVSLLVKNMPLEDRTRYGRLKDIIPFVLGSTDAKVRMIDAESAFKQQNRDMTGAVDSIRHSLSSIREQLADNHQQVGGIIHSLNSNLSHELAALGLEEDQENYILDQFDDASQGINVTLTRSTEIMENMAQLVQELEHLTAHQDQLINETLAIPVEDEPDEAGDVELF